MKFPEKVTVTDQGIDLRTLSGKQKEYFTSISERVREKYIDSNSERFIVSLSGPSGSGKSVTSMILQELLSNEADMKFVSVDLDAFHFSNSKLEERGLMDVKGRYDTYDTQNLLTLLEEFKNGGTVQFPKYSRVDHEPKLDGPIAEGTKTVLFIAGLWFQRNDPTWDKIREQIDYSLSIDEVGENARENTINRHMRGGRSQREAIDFYRKSDAKNNEEIKANSVPVDEVISYFENIH